jgi:hypothetical protein
MATLRTLRDAVLSRREERRRRSQLRRDILGYRTPAERDELLAILARYDMTIEDVLAGRQPPPLSADSSPDRWDEAWGEIVLDLSSRDD